MLPFSVHGCLLIELMILLDLEKQDVFEVYSWSIDTLQKKKTFYSHSDTKVKDHLKTDFIN